MRNSEHCNIAGFSILSCRAIFHFAACFSCIIIDDFATIISNNCLHVMTPKCVNRSSVTICVGCEELVVQHHKKDFDAKIVIQVGPACDVEHVNHIHNSIRVDLGILW
jgi:hypothetical protein